MKRKTMALLGAIMACTQTAAMAQDGTVDPVALLHESAEAHGGAENWLATPAIRLRFTMHLTTLAPDPSVGRTWSHSWRNYDVVADPDTSRTYVDILFADHPGADAGFDGRRLWDVGIIFDPTFNDPAFMLSWYHYAMIALPFIAERDGAEITYLGMEQVPGHPEALHKIKIDYSSLGWQGDMILFIDPETKLLRAWENGAMFPPLPGNPVPGVPLPPTRPLRVADEYFQVGGFTLPRAYVSYTPARDYSSFHLVTEAEILDAFDEAAAAAPEGAHVTFDREQAE